MCVSPAAFIWHFQHSKAMAIGDIYVKLEQQLKKCNVLCAVSVLLAEGCIDISVFPSLCADDAGVIQAQSQTAVNSTLHRTRAAATG